MSHHQDNPVREAILRRVAPIDVQPFDRGDDSPLDWSDLGYLSQGLAWANRPLSESTKAVTERHDLGPRGAWMLNLIAGGVCFPHELSEVFGIGKSLISADLSRLTEAGLITSKPAADDKRRTELALTPAGLAAREEIREAMAANLRQALAEFTPSQVRLMSRMLAALRGST